MGAMCDIRTGKIIGCKEGSKNWYHEKAHLIFNDTENGMRVGYHRELFSYLSLILLVGSMFINYLKYLSLFCILISITAYVYEEIWCEVYARKKFKENGNKINNKVDNFN